MNILNIVRVEIYWDLSLSANKNCMVVKGLMRTSNVYGDIKFRGDKFNEMKLFFINRYFGYCINGGLIDYSFENLIELLKD